MASAPLENADLPPATQDGQQEPEGEEVAPVPVEAKLPTRKDISLKEFLNKMDDYAPIVSTTPFTSRDG
jgi:transcription initiation factor TFIID subunit 10